MEVRYAQSGDLNVAYRVLGNGPLDLVWVPNWVSNVDWIDEPVFERFFGRIGAFARVIVFDRRGTGLSDPSIGAPTLEERMDDIRAVMDAAGSERAALFGYSEGGPMASLFAASHPDRISALILFGSYAKTTATDDYPWGPATTDGRWGRMIGNWGTGKNLAEWVPSAEEDPAIQAWWGRYERNAVSPGALLEILRLNAEIDIRDVLPAIRVPTLVLHRTADRTIAVENSRYLAEHIPGARLVELPGADHSVIFGDSDAVAAEMEEFLTGAREAHEPDRVLATVLFTDIVGSTQHLHRLGDRRYSDLLSRHHGLIRRELQRFRGREVKTIGDGFLATFDGPARAIRAAHEITRCVRELGVEVRCGLHTGECEVLGDDVGGIAVHIAARVTDAAEPSEVLVSSTVKDLVVGSGLHFADRGVQVLRGVPGEWRLFRLAEQQEAAA
jgi:pimeloyl-ACP methyl ester carboxylesterase